MRQQLPARPAMRGGDTFRVVAIDDECFDRRRLEQLAAQVVEPRCVLHSFASLDQGLRAGLMFAPHLVILDDALEGGIAGETSIAGLREHGYDGPIAILSGLRRPHRNPDLVRAGAMIYLAKDDLNVGTFHELIDMAMALSKIMRARRTPESNHADVARLPGEERRMLDIG